MFSFRAFAKTGMQTGHPVASERCGKEKSSPKSSDGHPNWSKWPGEASEEVGI